MLAEKLISESVPPLKTSDTGLKALSWMDEFRVSHLPIVNNFQLLGVITEEDIMDLNEPEQPLGNHKLSLTRPYVYESQHIYDVVKLIHSQQLTVVPVLDEKNHYVGVITMHDLVKSFANMCAIDNPGGIIVLELGVRDYSLTEIARLVESNDAKILSVYLTSQPDSAKIELTLKIDKTELTHILATFERFNYTIKASFHQNEFVDHLRDRYESFIRYLNI